jgi:hypothetical protein
MYKTINALLESKDIKEIKMLGDFNIHPQDIESVQEQFLILTRGTHKEIIPLSQITKIICSG